jgi:hypothetical protein
MTDFTRLVFRSLLIVVVLWAIGHITRLALFT